MHCKNTLVKGMALVQNTNSNERQVVGHYSWTHKVEGSILRGGL